MKDKVTLKRLEKLAHRRAGQPQIDTIEVYCDGVLLEVIRLGAAARTASHERT